MTAPHFSTRPGRIVAAAALASAMLALPATGQTPPPPATPLDLPKLECGAKPEHPGKMASENMQRQWRKAGVHLPRVLQDLRFEHACARAALHRSGQRGDRPVQHGGQGDTGRRGRRRGVGSTRATPAIRNPQPSPCPSPPPPSRAAMRRPRSRPARSRRRCSTASTSTTRCSANAHARGSAISRPATGSRSSTSPATGSISTTGAWSRRASASCANSAPPAWTARAATACGNRSSSITSVC